MSSLLAPTVLAMVDAPFIIWAIMKLVSVFIKKKLR
jgi:hypothetical protein